MATSASFRKFLMMGAPWRTLQRATANFSSPDHLWFAELELIQYERSSRGPIDLGNVLVRPLQAYAS